MESLEHLGSKYIFQNIFQIFFVRKKLEIFWSKKNNNRKNENFDRFFWGDQKIFFYFSDQKFSFFSIIIFSTKKISTFFGQIFFDDQKTLWHFQKNIFRSQMFQRFQKSYLENCAMRPGIRVPAIFKKVVKSSWSSFRFCSKTRFWQPQPRGAAPL